MSISPSSNANLYAQTHTHTEIPVSVLSCDQGFPCSSVGKEFACSAGDPDSMLGLGKCSGEGNGSPLQYPCLENLMDRGACWAAVPGVTKSWTQLGDYHLYVLPRWLSGKESTSKYKDLGLIPGLGKFPWRRAWQPTPVFLPGESQGQRSLVGYSPWGHRETRLSD